MRLTHLRQADLNLLVVFAILAEERNISRAADRILLSQPAVTRALQRLRDMFHDDLLVRVSGDYKLTPKGEKLLHEVESMLPRLDRMLSDGEFNPSAEPAHFRLAGTDYAAHVISVPLARHFLTVGHELSFDMAPITDGAFDAMDRGRIDLLLHADDGNIPPHLLREVIFKEEFLCVVTKNSSYDGQLTLEQYLEAQHIGVTIREGLQTIPDQRLSAAGLQRSIAFRVPFFTAAIQAVAGTKLIATVPRRMALHPSSQSSELKLVKPPKPLSQWTYVMAWHARMDKDAAHIWLRNAVRTITETV